MKMYHLISGLLRVNCYVLVNDLGEAVVIDGGENYKKIKPNIAMVSIPPL